MKTKTKTEKPQYSVRIYWSDEDEAYIAKVPALRGCIAHGGTYAEAAREIEIVMALWLESARKHHDPIPAPDLAREEIGRMAPLLNYSKLAKLAGINRQTLQSKLDRRTPFTDLESRAILEALEVDLLKESKARALRKLVPKKTAAPAKAKASGF